MKETQQFIFILVLFYMSFLYFNNKITENYSADEEKYSSWLSKVKYGQKLAKMIKSTLITKIKPPERERTSMAVDGCILFKPTW